MDRPKIEEIYTGEELKQWYWLKQELVDYCKLAGIGYSGSKFYVLDRIADHLDGIDTSIAGDTKILKSPLKKAWSKIELSDDTIITADYTNGPNTRKFFKTHCGQDFHFNIPFMAWMKNNPGKTLRQAINEWKRLQALSKEKTFHSIIPKHNQYNQYIRDFFAANPDKKWADARAIWKLKRALPLVKHIYDPSDLLLLQTDN